MVIKASTYEFSTIQPTIGSNGKKMQQKRNINREVEIPKMNQISA